MTKKCIRRFRVAVLYSVLSVLLIPAAAYSQGETSNQDCLACHDTISGEAYGKSVHARNLCTSCHNDIKEVPHQEKLAKVDCSRCHNTESQIYNSSDHGMAVKTGLPAAGCLDCHGKPHAILDTRNSQSPVYRMNVPKTCAACHDDEKKMSKYNLLEKNPYASYAETVHGKGLIEDGMTSAAICTDCHGSHNLSSPLNPNSKIYRGNVPATCGKCHENVFITYSRSIHGKAAAAGNKDAPVCTDCHGEHTIKSHKDPTSSVYSTVIAKKTCGQCHAAERIVTKYRLPGDRLDTYMQSYHGLASKSGITTAANCSSCHGIHNILPAKDPDSDVNPRNLPKTCGKCHPNAGKELAKGAVHLSPSRQQDQAVFYVTCIYMFLIVMTIGGMLAHNALDFFVTLKNHYRKHKKEDTYMRFTLIERIQHLGLIVSFASLAYTGFAFRFPNALWAVPFKLWNPGYDWRGVIHRIMAAVFIALVILHTYYLFFTSRGKKQRSALLIRWRDFTDFFRTLAYYFGMRKEKPKYATYNYIEKSEYWALVWGSIIMIITGSVLTFESFLLHFIPKWILDVIKAIHYYEALLAVLAIIVWHFYFNIFHPDHYPINLAMTTGKVPKEEKREGEAEEDEEGK